MNESRNISFPLLTKEILSKELHLFIPCDRQGQVSRQERKKLTKIKPPSAEHEWSIALRCNQGGNALVDPFTELHFETAEKALQYALNHPDRSESIETWANIDWKSYGMSGQTAYPTQYEIECIHPEVRKWGEEEGYQKYLKSHGI